MADYDVIWIGTGQATGTVVPRLTGAGRRVAVIEGGEVGGSCVNYGCTPTKTMVASARAAHMAQRGPDFGVEIPEYSIDMATVMKRMNAMRDNSGMTEWLRTMDGVDFFAEYAHFVSDHEVQVGDRVISGDTIVVHTGTKGQTLFGALAAGILASIASHMAGDEDNPDALAPFLGVALAALLSPLLLIAFPGLAGVEKAVVADALPGFARLQPLDWGVALLIGVPVGLNWMGIALGREGASTAHAPANA